MKRHTRAEDEPGFLWRDLHGPAFRAPEEPDTPLARQAELRALPGEPWWSGANNTIQRAPVDGGSQLSGYGHKGLLHGTETGGWPSYSTNFHPNLTVAVVSGRFAARGHIRHDRAGRALRNTEGGVQTNRAQVRQVEIVGYARNFDGYGLPEAIQDGLGRYAEWLEREWGVPRVSTVRFKKYLGGSGDGSYGLSNGVRLGYSAWNEYAGWLAHMHAPENTHGDVYVPALHLDRILSSEEDSLMALTQENITDALKAAAPEIGAQVRTALDPIIASPLVFLSNPQRTDWGVYAAVPGVGLVHVVDPPQYTQLSGEGLGEGNVIAIPGNNPIWTRVPRYSELTAEGATFIPGA